MIITTYDLLREGSDAARRHRGEGRPCLVFRFRPSIYRRDKYPKTGKGTDYKFPTLALRVSPSGFLEIQTDPEGNVWAAGMHQMLIGKVDFKTKKITTYPIPAEWTSNSTQESMVSPQYSNVDGKVWTNNQDDHSILRLDVKTGKFENLGVMKDASGKEIDAYGIPPDQDNNLYLLQFRGAQFGRVDAKTKEVKIFDTPFPNSRPRRGRWGADGNMWFAENGANAVASFDPRTNAVKEYVMPVKQTHPYDALRNDRGDIWTGGEYTDLMTRYNVATSEAVNYLMPQEVNVRCVFFDNARNEFWVGANHSAEILRVEPLD